MQNNLPKVSVIIPVLNGEKTLDPCIDSVLKQTYQNFEIIIVDNDSKDRTKEIIDNYSKKDSRIKYIFEERKSRGIARNTGEHNASGEIIIMTDSDCTVPKKWIKDMVGPILNKECDAVQGGEESATNDYWSKQEQIRIEEKRQKIKAGDWPLGVVDTKNFAILRQTLEKIGYTNTEYKSVIDTALSVELKRHNIKLVYKPEIKVAHRHPDNIWKVVSKKINRGFYFKKLIDSNKEFLKGTNFIKSGETSFLSLLENIKRIFNELFDRGISHTIFDLITGIAWKMGVLWRIINKIITIKHVSLD